MADEAQGPVRPLVEHLFRHQSGQMLATLTRIFGLQDWDLAEEAVQEAMLQALRKWPFQGIPANPRGWLGEVARNKALDLLRRRGLKRRREGKGYLSHQGEELVRQELCAEAIRLCGLLLTHPATAAPKVHALYALMCLQAAR